MFDDLVKKKAEEPEEHYEYIDMVGKKCTHCSTLGMEPGIYKRALIEMYVNLYVICNNCAHKNDRFKIKEN